MSEEVDDDEYAPGVPHSGGAYACLRSAGVRRGRKYLLCERLAPRRRTRLRRKAGLALEDFRWHDAFAAFLDHLSTTTHDDAELVIVGDMLELWQSTRMKCSTVVGVVSCTVEDCVGSKTGCSEQEALDRLKNVVNQHKYTLSKLGDFAQRGKNRVVIVPGNHDAALLFPGVAALLKQAIGAPQDRVTVAMTGRWQSADGKVLAEHGHQFDRVNSFDGWPTPFVMKDGKQVMERPGGELLVQTFYNRYEQQFEAIDNFASETEGMGYAIKNLRAKGVVVGIDQFAYFLLIRSSLEQRFDWLGRPPQGGDAEWDIARIRKDNNVTFVLTAFPPKRPSGRCWRTRIRRESSRHCSVS